MALYEVVLRTRYVEQLCINVFNYWVTPGIGVTPNALDLLTLMGLIPIGTPLAFPANTIGEQLQLLQSDNLTYLSAEARELYSLTDFYEAVYAPGLAGGATGGDSMPPFVSYGLYSSRVRTDIKRGTKRFAGAMESGSNAGGTVVGTAAATLVDLAAEMSATLTGFSADYVPCVVSREFIPATEDDPAKYQLYADPAEQAEHLAIGVVWTPYEHIRSQVSRQRGRGI